MKQVYLPCYNVNPTDPLQISRPDLKLLKENLRPWSLQSTNFDRRGLSTLRLVNSRHPAPAPAHTAHRPAPDSTAGSDYRPATTLLWERSGAYALPPWLPRHCAPHGSAPGSLTPDECGESPGAGPGFQTFWPPGEVAIKVHLMTLAHKSVRL